MVQDHKVLMILDHKSDVKISKKLTESSTNAADAMRAIHVVQAWVGLSLGVDKESLTIPAYLVMIKV